jgi:hypothetical protein
MSLEVIITMAKDTTPYLIIGAASLGGLMLYKSGALTKAPVEVPDTSPATDPRKVVYRVESAKDAYIGWATKWEKDRGAFPPEREVILWIHDYIGFHEGPAWELRDWINMQWATTQDIGTRQEWADEIHLLARQYGYTEQK